MPDLTIRPQIARRPLRAPRGAQDGLVVGRRAGLLALVCVALAACGSSSSASPTSAPPTSAAPSGSLQPFVPASASEVYPPSGSRSGPVPVVVTVPGGGWQTANREYLAPLAQRLAAGGAFVVNTTYRAGEVGARFPVALQDVRCAAGYAVAAARTAGFTPGPVVLVGHSAGGHLVALAAVSGDALAAPCADPVPHIDAAVGLAGVYDAAAGANLIGSFFGVPRASDPSLWDSGDPLHYVTTGAAPRPLGFLLVHGADDAVVPVSQSRTFAAALTKAGIPVRLDVLTGESHSTVVDPAVVGDEIAAYVADLAASTRASASP